MNFQLPEDDKNNFWPTQLVLEATSLCNLSCFMCNVHAPHVDSGKHAILSKATFENLRPIFTSLQWVSFGGNGEPFLAKDIFWQIEQIRKVNPAVCIQAFSNGLLFREVDLLDAALENIDKLDLSIDAIRPHVYSSIRIGGSINETIESLTNIKRRQPLHSRCHVSITALLMRRTLSDIMALVETAARYNITEISFHGPIWTIDDVTRRELIDDQMTYERMWAELWHAKKVGKRLGVKVDFRYAPLGSVTVPSAPLSERARARLKSAINRMILFFKGSDNGRSDETLHVPCFLPWQSIEVFANGVVYICCQQRTPIGNLASNSIKEIWFGKEAINYRRGMRGGQYYGGCQKCSYIFKHDYSSYNRP